MLDAPKSPNPLQAPRRSTRIRQSVKLPKSNEVPIKVEDDDVIEACKQSSTETREDTREQAPPDTRVETIRPAARSVVFGAGRT